MHWNNVKNEFKFFKLFKYVLLHTCTFCVSHLCKIGLYWFSWVRKEQEKKCSKCLLFWDTEEIQTMVESTCKLEQSCE